MRGPHTADSFFVPSLFITATFAITTGLFYMAFLGHNSNTFHLQFSLSIIPIDILVFFSQGFISFCFSMSTLFTHVALTHVN